MSNETLVSRKYRKRSRMGEVWHRLKKNKGAMVGLMIILILIFIALTCDIWMSYEDDVISQNISQRLQKPSLEHPLGTDTFGRDLLNRLLYATRYSLSVGFVAVLVALFFGLIFGSLAGYYVGTPIDNIIMRGLDILHAVPSLLLGIVLVTAIGASTATLMIAVGVAAVPTLSRTVRAAVLTTRNEEFIESARAIGVPEWKIILKHILPNCLSPIIVQLTLRIGNSIIAASSLSFLGLGVPAPAPEWGGMLSDGRQFLRGSPHITLFPGLAIMITVLAFNMIGDGVRDALDPKLKQ